MFNFFANLFGYILNYIYNIVQNYGLAIIIFTILLKIFMLPISINQQKTIKKSAKLQVKVKEIQNKYSNDQVRQSQELMDLYKREKMSPFSGCLSSIVQFIIIISIFYLVSRPLTYMIHFNQDILNKYVKEISENGEQRVNYTEIAVIREKGNEDKRVALNMDFLGLDLSSIPSQNYSDWKVFIIPVLYVITSFVSMKITTNMQKKENEVKAQIDNKEKSEEEQTMAEMSKSMTYMMPAMAVSISLIAPLGLALYWLVSNLLMIAERFVINKFVKEEE
ncbi:MAG: YidC/Oxa1 family membrane protein insertase [Clostridia bacterium]|nr:YidC/Oxa1 family membrane protein insertase [Clostridia bacterium]